MAKRVAKKKSAKPASDIPNNYLHSASRFELEKLIMEAGAAATELSRIHSQIFQMAGDLQSRTPTDRLIDSVMETAKARKVHWSVVLLEKWDENLWVTLSRIDKEVLLARLQTNGASNA